MTRRRKAISPVPLGPGHRRDWRAFWQRCTCGLGAPCVDRLVPVAPLPFPARPGRAALPISPLAPLIAGPDHALPFAATNGNASKPRPLTPDEINQFRIAHGGITATSTPPMSRKTPRLVGARQPDRASFVPSSRAACCRPSGCRSGRAGDAADTGGRPLRPDTVPRGQRPAQPPLQRPTTHTAPA